MSTPVSLAWDRPVAEAVLKAILEARLARSTEICLPLDEQGATETDITDAVSGDETWKRLYLAAMILGAAIAQADAADR